ncbi:MAG: hypothetical protein J3K34DRAFT_417093 [Monoraphidium minutum]|nr:MAG: hypothetical protein J3K34DRAFT_417093 [Monoraphidium minutum]
MGTLCASSQLRRRRGAGDVGGGCAAREANLAPPLHHGRAAARAAAHHGSEPQTLPFTMATNSLLAKAQLGKPRPTTFVSPDPGHVFGIKMPPDAEGAKQVTLMWKQHQPNPHAKPGPDFKAMNRLAADNGLTGTRGVRAFREAHAVAVKCGAAVLASKAPPLPREKDPRSANGKPKGYRHL